MPFDATPVQLPLSKEDQQAWDIIHGALDILKDKERWIQNTYYDGSRMRHCLIGAFDTLTVGHGILLRDHNTNSAHDKITDWNDGATRKHKSVVNALEGAQEAILKQEMPKKGIRKWLITYARAAATHQGRMAKR